MSHSEEEDGTSEENGEVDSTQRKKLETHALLLLLLFGKGSLGIFSHPRKKDTTRTKKCIQAQTEGMGTPTDPTVTDLKEVQVKTEGRTKVDTVEAQAEKERHTVEEHTLKKRVKAKRQLKVMS